MRPAWSGKLKRNTASTTPIATPAASVRGNETMPPMTAAASARFSVLGPRLSMPLGVPASPESRIRVALARSPAIVQTNIDTILVDPDKAMIPTQLSVLYAVVTAVAAKVTKANFPMLGRYAERLVERDHGDQAVLLVMEATRRMPELQRTSTFVKLTTGNMGQLFHPALQGK